MKRIKNKLLRAITFLLTVTQGIFMVSTKLFVKAETP